MDRVTNIAWRTTGDATLGGELPFSWNYLDGSDLKSSLAYPNGITASWQYDANGQLLQVKNAFPTNTISQYDYTYDAAGRRVACGKSGCAFAQNDTLSYCYNEKSELTNAVAAVDSDYRYAYDFDDIGNRESSSERGTNSVYTSNSLNQYTAVDDFAPQFDDDGNQTLVKTATGIWQVQYNGENRPVLWRQGDVSLVMSYDRMGRRIKLVKLEGWSISRRQLFSYNGYLQVQRRTQEPGMSAAFHIDQFGWNPTESIATRPLVWNFSTFQSFNISTSYYTHDGNKNVSEVVAVNSDVTVHYEYAPFGAVAIHCGEFTADSPWRFSSEYAEDDLDIAYYNYRLYEPLIGRWLSRDPMEEFASESLYRFCDNQFSEDWLGLEKCVDNRRISVNKGVGYRRRYVGPYMFRMEQFDTFDYYVYELSYDKNCDEFNHAHIQNLSITGDYEMALDSLGFDIGYGSISLGLQRDYVVEIVERPARTNKDATCVYVDVDVSIYRIIGVSIGGSLSVGKKGSIGSTVGPLQGKTYLGGYLEHLKHCCCDSDKESEGAENRQ